MNINTSREEPMATLTLKFRRDLGLMEKILLDILIGLAVIQDSSATISWDDKRTVCIDSTPGWLEELDKMFSGVRDLRTASITGRFRNFWEQQKKNPDVLQVLHGISTAFVESKKGWKTCPTCNRPAELHYRYCLGCGYDFHESP